MHSLSPHGPTALTGLTGAEIPVSENLGDLCVNVVQALKIGGIQGPGDGTDLRQLFHPDVVSGIAVYPTTSSNMHRNASHDGSSGAGALSAVLP